MGLYNLIYDTCKENTSKDLTEFLIMSLDYGKRVATFDKNSYNFNQIFVCSRIEDYVNKLIEEAAEKEVEYVNRPFQVIAFRLNDEIIVIDRLI